MSERATALEAASDRELSELAITLREAAEHFDTKNLPDQHTQQQIAGAALIREAIRRAAGLKYHDEQLLAGMVQAEGQIAEIATGEGKTIVSAIPSFLAWLDGRKTHVATANTYLAQRDFKQLQPVLDLLGLTASLLPVGDDVVRKATAYRSDVVFGTGYEFGFDYLRDQVALRTQSPPEREPTRPSSLQPLRRLVIVDEIDSVLLDEAMTPLTLSERRHEVASIGQEKSSLARITRQRFFQLYDSLCGMSGTVRGAEEEFSQIYGLKTVLIPRHRACRRVDLPDRFFASKDAKFRAIIGEVIERHRCGQPVLIGTRTIADSEILSTLLKSLRLPHDVLYGLQDANEAAAIANAGRYGAVTVATNMAGRGTDIKPDDRALAVGGLFIIGMERHESRRIDRQLAGRAGRQGDFGFSRFFVSGDDDLLQRFAPKLAKRLRKNADRSGEVHDNYSPLVTQFQALAEAQSFALRRKMLEDDRWLDDVLAGVL